MQAPLSTRMARRAPPLQIALINHINNIVMCHRLAEVRRVRAHNIITQQRLVEEGGRAANVPEDG